MAHVVYYDDDVGDEAVIYFDSPFSNEPHSTCTLDRLRLPSEDIGDRSLMISPTLLRFMLEEPGSVAPDIIARGMAARGEHLRLVEEDGEPDQ